jgi:hypothetical protein
MAAGPVLASWDGGVAAEVTSLGDVTVPPGAEGSSSDIQEG